MYDRNTGGKSVEEVAAETAQAVAEASERRSWLSITALSGVLFGLVGFYDPAKDLYKQLTDSAYQNVPSVKLADYQQQLWVKNDGCIGSLTMQETVLNPEVTVRAGACPNKDVLVQVFPKSSPAVSNWITPGNLKEKTAGLFSAFAASFELSPDNTSRSEARPVQMTVSTVCQGWADPARKAKLIRVVSENGKCFKEITNVYSGRVEYREAVPCNTVCK